MQKIIKINIREPTNKKRIELSKLYEEYLACSKKIFGIWKKNKGITQTTLHHLTYKSFRKKYNLSADLIISARTSVWNRRKICKEIKSLPIRFNSKLFSITTSKNNNFIIRFAGYTKNKRIALPVIKDGAYFRLVEHIQNKWKISSILLFKDFRVQVLIKKEFEKPIESKNIIGVDVNVSNIAVSVYNSKKQKFVRQIYLGQDILHKRRKIERRKEKLQSLADLGSSRAKKSLFKLKHKERNFIKDYSWKLAHQIVSLSKSFGNATIVVENLYKLKMDRKKGKSFGRKTNRKINKMPYGKLFHYLACLCEENFIRFKKINPYHTSKICSRCGVVNEINSKNYKTYVCKSCGLIMNRDRNASRNIAKLFVERSIVTNVSQTSTNRVSVNAPLLSDDVCAL